MQVTTKTKLQTQAWKHKENCYFNSKKPAYDNSEQNIYTYNTNTFICSSTVYR